MTARFPIPVLVLALVLGGHAAPALLRWQTDVARPQPRDWEVFAGETVVLAPVMTEGGAGVDLSGSTCALWYQTNGMAGAWWSVPAATGTVAGEVRATWSPTNDCGAARYNYFVAAASSAGTMYRAFGRLVMRHAPGATPSILAAPTTLTDAMQAWADSRYDPAGAAQVVSNALADAMQHIQPSGGGDSTNWQPIVYSMTNGAALGETALQPSWAATGNVYRADYAASADVATYSYNALSADVATYSYDATALKRTDPDGQALDAATAHITDPAAHPDIRAAIDAIPLPPTNAVAGWLVWDSGSNCYWQVTATNLRFYVWGVAE